LFSSLLEAADSLATKTGTGTGTGLGSVQSGSIFATLFGNPLILFVAMGLVMYFLIYRPNQKKQKTRQQMLSAVKKNDKVMTIGGIIGTVAAVKKDVISVKIDDKTKIDFRISAIDRVLEGDGIPQTSQDNAIEESK
jgi:preprotein translocase subunit YajC